MLGVDILKPYSESSIASGLIYLSGLVIFLSLDMIKFKSRTFVMAMSLMELSWTAYLIYYVTFANTEVGVIVFTGVGSMPFLQAQRKANTLYTQVFLFSLDGIRTIALDRSMEMMIFTTGHVSRHLTSSPHHQDEDVVNSSTFKLAKVRTKSRQMILLVKKPNLIRKK